MIPASGIADLVLAGHATCHGKLDEERPGLCGGELRACERLAFRGAFNINKQ